MKTIALNGCMTLDTIYPFSEKMNKDFQTIVRAGGIANCARAFKSYKDIFCKFGYNSPVPHFEIDLNIDDNQKQTLQVNEYEYIYRYVKADWHHFAYLDVLHDVDQEIVESINDGGFISADLCLNSLAKDTQTRVISLLPYLDYLFISDNETQAFSQKSQPNEIDYVNTAHEFGKLTRHGVIYHTANEIRFFKKDGCRAHFISGKSNLTRINVVGAGDYLAAHIIARLLKERTDYYSLLHEAYEQTRFMLKGDKIEN